MQYQLVSFQTPGGPAAGIAMDERVADAAAITGSDRYRTMRGILDDWAVAELAIERAMERFAGHARPRSAFTLVAPLPDPVSVFCAGANYADHVANMARAKGVAPEPNGYELGLYPFCFLKSPRCVAPPYSTVRAAGSELDYEAELVAVIGRTTSCAPVGEALDAVAGYTIANDLSARGRMVRTAHQPGSPFRFDWVSHKNFDGACPMGPAIVPAKAVGDPQVLAIKTWVDDELRQDSSTRHMIYSVASLISEISHRITLHPGDVILTGTPAGVGAEDGRFLQPGSRVRVEIERLGQIETIIAADSRG